MGFKYEITDIQHPKNPNLFRIRALRDIPSIWVKAGYLGGYVENENNLSQEGDCWVGDDAVVYGNAIVSGDAFVYEYTEVFGNALVYGNVHVYGNALVYGNAHIFGKALVFNNARVYSNAQVYDNAKVLGNACIYENATINENMIISQGCYITSSSQIYYVDGITAYFDTFRQLKVNGSSPDIEHHKMLARLKLS